MKRLGEAASCPEDGSTSGALTLSSTFAITRKTS
ncbi:hypothetical protein LINGRAHAP2_LOCUS11694 [Linum grandiflorum]